MKRLFSFIFICFLIFFAPAIIAQEKAEYFTARIGNVSQNKIEIVFLSGKLKDQKRNLTQDYLRVDKNLPLKKGDEVILSYDKDIQGNEQILITDYVRTTPLLYLFALFLLTVVLIGKFQGIRSFISMVVSFVIIGNFILPSLIAGNNPVLISLLGALLIIPISFYLSHGLNRKTTIAVAATFLTLMLTAGLAVFFVELTKLTGFAAEESIYLQFLKGGALNIKSLLLAGIIIGALGVLDDITISQASIVEELYHANSKLTFKELYGKSMNVGRDHIASLVNTLVLVYTGASLPLFLLAYDTQVSLTMALNHEVVATEIVRTLVSSIGIIAAVPIATVLAVWAVKRA